MMGERTVIVELDSELSQPDASTRIWSVCTVVENIAALQYSH